MVVGLVEEREGSGASHFVEDGAPGTSSGEVVERGQVGGQVVESGEFVG